MSKCITCGKKGDGVICSHCLANTATKVGKSLKKVGVILLAVAPTVITVISARDKNSSND